jgi:meckelin
MATQKPNINDLSDGTINHILLFATEAICWLVVIAIQLIFRFLIFDRFYRNRLMQYSDVMSLSNISLLILDERYHGYYIHGRSVHATADTDMQELINFLQKEAVLSCFI